MKKFSAIVAVLLVVVMLAGSAFASGISVSGKYDGTYITWTVNGDFGFGYDVKVDGALELADWTLAKGQLKIALDTTVDHKVTVESDNGSDYFIIPAVKPTAKPTAVPTAEPTAAPTQAPVEDEVEDDDVPKTGDNSASYVIASVAMLLAAAYLVSRRFSRA